MNLSNSLRTILANRGLSKKPCGVPSWGIICLPLSLSIYPATSDFLIRSKVLSQIIVERRILFIVSCGILSKHLDISPWMTH